MLTVHTDEHFMKLAMAEAQRAYDADEVPVGAVIVAQQQVIARAHNLTERLTDVTAHAELQAFTSASDYLGGKYLKGCTLYVTLEPCVMCAGAAYWTQIDRIVIGATDPKRGFNRIQERLLHPKTIVQTGIMAAESQALLQRFFQDKRRQARLG
jgi:tRNA(adenine34) deaminase